jgi:beta-lactamase regulating signal transducer with metallopeptidase domain
VDFVANWLVQGCVVALATVVIVRCLPRALAATRYLVCWVGLSAVLALPLVALIPVALSLMQGVTVDTTASGALVSLPQSPTFAPLIIGAWLVWAAVFGAQLATAMVAMQRAQQRCRSFPLALERRLRNWTRVKHEGRAARLVLSNDVLAAAVIGCGSPVIAVAPALVRHLTAAELDRVVIHEWAHVQRRDDFANVGQLMARLLAGWHPGVWWLDRWLRAEREVACDEMAVMQTGSSKTYAACLLRLASLPLASRETLPALGVLSSVSLASRVERIVSRTGQASPNRSRTLLTLSVLLLVGVSLAIGSLRIVEAGAISSEVQAAADEPLTPAEIANESAHTIAHAAVPATVSQMPRNASTSRPVTTVRQSLPDAAPPADAPTGRASDDAPSDVVVRTTPAVANLVETYTTETEGIETPVESVPPHAPPPSTSLQAPNLQRVIPWTAAADAGVSLGQRSKDGGLATARFFSRFGKRIADSF